ncbi:MAG: NifU family protein [Alphaproteobacteria bacterium]
MFIQTEETPNPATLKFLPGREVMGAAGTRDFRDASGAGVSPLAESLFAVGGVAGVFLGRDFVTVTKGEGQDWPALKPVVLGTIMDHFTSGRPVVNEGSAAVEAPGGAADSDIVTQIKEILDYKIRPAVAQDGGDIVFDKFEDGVVYLHMQGACAGCPSSSATLKTGIENMLRHYIPEVTEVRQAAS